MTDDYYTVGSAPLRPGSPERRTAIGAGPGLHGSITNSWARTNLVARQRAHLVKSKLR
jgi:hypothetical protein